MSVVTVITNPDQFFDQASDDPGLLAPSLVVLLAALLATASVVPMLQYVQQSLVGDASQLAVVFYVGGLAGGLLTPFVAWVLLTGLMHALTGYAFDGDGSFTTTLSFVGWGYVPALLSGLLSAVVNVWVFSSRAPQAISDPQQAQAFVQSVQGVPALKVVTVVGIAITLWQGLIWTFAVKHGRNVSERAAAISAGVPTLALVVLSASSLV
jgi:hypothetical protein